MFKDNMSQMQVFLMVSLMFGFCFRCFSNGLILEINAYSRFQVFVDAGATGPLRQAHYGECIRCCSLDKDFGAPC